MSAAVHKSISKKVIIFAAAIIMLFVGASVFSFVKYGYFNFPKVIYAKKYVQEHTAYEYDDNVFFIARSSSVERSLQSFTSEINGKNLILRSDGVRDYWTVDYMDSETKIIVEKDSGYNSGYMIVKLVK